MVLYPLYNWNPICQIPKPVPFHYSILTLRSFSSAPYFYIWAGGCVREEKEKITNQPTKDQKLGHRKIQVLSLFKNNTQLVCSSLDI